MKCPHCQHHIVSRRSITVEHNGEPMSLRELARSVGLPPSTLIHRYRRGWRMPELISASRPHARKHPPTAGNVLPGE